MRSDTMRYSRALLAASLMLGLIGMMLLASVPPAGAAAFSRVEILGRPGHGEASTYTLRGTIPREGYDGYVQLYLRSDATIISANGYDMATGETLGAVTIDNRGTHENGQDTIYTFIVPEGQDFILEFSRPEPLQMTETDGNLISRFGYTAVAPLPELAVGFAAPEGKAGIGDGVELITTSDIGNRYYGKVRVDVEDEEVLVFVVKFVDQSDAERAAEDASRITTVSIEETTTPREGWFSWTAVLWILLALVGVAVIAAALFLPGYLEKQRAERPRSGRGIDYR